MLVNKIKEYFKIDERGSSISQEVRAGLASFLTMSYVLLLNPIILNKIGLPPKDIAIGTALSSGILLVVLLSSILSLPL